MEDAVLFGAQAVNAYVDEPRMTQGVDIASPRAAELAEQLRAHLNARFHVAIRVENRRRTGLPLVPGPEAEEPPLGGRAPGWGFAAGAANRRRIGRFAEELIAGKLIAYQRRQGTPKSGTDWRDLAVLLLKFPELKTKSGPVRDRLEAAGAVPTVIAGWENLVAQRIEAEEDEDEF